MSCSPEEYKQLQSLTKCGDLPQPTSTTGKIYAVVDRINNDMFVGKSEQECKMAIIGLVNESSHHAHLHDLTTDDLVLINLDQVEIHKQSIKEAMAAIGGRHMERAPLIVHIAETAVREIMIKYSYDKKSESTKPDKMEIRQRNEEYRNRQRYHNRR